MSDKIIPDSIRITIKLISLIGKMRSLVNYVIKQYPVSHIQNI